MFDKMKRRSMLGQVQNAASDAVDSTIQASVAANRFVDRIGDSHQQPPQPPHFINQHTSSLNHPGPAALASNMHSAADVLDGNRDGWNAFCNQESVHRKSLLLCLYCMS
jgi:E3 ubiquitin-protein ligase CCNP1IP1